MVPSVFRVGEDESIATANARSDCNDVMNAVLAKVSMTRTKIAPARNRGKMRDWLEGPRNTVVLEKNNL